MTRIQILDADVLVLGAGLAGLMAAQAAALMRPGLRVALAWAGKGPSGSSFANRNGQLGLFLPHKAYADGPQSLVANRFAEDATRLAAPGWIDPSLVLALAEDAPARFADMAGLGVSLLRDEKGAPVLRSSCFLPGRKGAIILTDLPDAFSRLRREAASLGARFLPGLRALRLIVDPDAGRICGALFQESDGGKPVLARARTVVAALGGPARLFSLCGSGAGNRGEGHALLALAGADMENERYLQFMWSELPGGDFFPFSRLSGAQARIGGPMGREEPLPAELAALIPSRMTHCPISHGLPDAALDRHLLARLGPDGALAVRAADGASLRIAPLAHAGNGGAHIDPDGRTSAPGLYAAGECATGMHGADRIGGAMVLSCLVFGARAGRAAAQEADALPLTPQNTLHELAETALSAIPAAPSGEPDARWTPPITPDMHAAFLTGDAARLAELAERFDRRFRETGAPSAHAAWRLAMAMA